MVEGTPLSLSDLSGEVLVSAVGPERPNPDGDGVIRQIFFVVASPLPPQHTDEISTDSGTGMVNGEMDETV